MKLIALILGLGLERLATQLLHMRELRWFDAYFDVGLARVGNAGAVTGYVIVLLLLIVALVPVLWASLALESMSVAWDLPYLLFAVLIVFFCLGPRDLASEVDDYCDAFDRGDRDAADTVLASLCEACHSDNEVEAVEDAIFVQATNRVFGVVFWFVALGPVGAWLFRLSELLRRRAAFESARDADAMRESRAIVETVHGVLAWVPARLAAVGYALSGSFDDALIRWRDYEPVSGPEHYRNNDRLLAQVGRAAMTGFLAQPTNTSAAARNAMRLVRRTLFIWLTVIGFMTVFGWAV